MSRTTAQTKDKTMTRKTTAMPSAMRELTMENPIINELLQMHTYCRPAGSETEALFNKRYLDSLPGMDIDGKGNRILRIPNADGSPSRILWSSHTDTVHAKGGRQRITYGGGILSLSKNADSSCLGADCTAGVWLMRQMILREVPGLYIFHAAEEIGGVGSGFIATSTPEVLDGIDYAIALDRRGTTSVITHQGSRCASDAFGNALAAQLSTKGNTFTLDTGGTFTDTANYTDFVPECTNLSVGYYGAHSAAEYLDVPFLAHLLERLCLIDPVTLPVVRKAGDSDFPWGNSSAWRSSSVSSPSTSSRASKTTTLEDYVYDYPKAAAQLLEDLGISADDFEQYLYGVH